MQPPAAGSPSAATGLEEVHIASLVVHAMPPRLAAVAADVAAMPGAQVHGSDAAGKLVVTIETLGGSRMLESIDRIRTLDGVVSASLVYQCADSVDAMNEDLADGDRTT